MKAYLTVSSKDKDVFEFSAFDVQSNQILTVGIQAAKIRVGRSESGTTWSVYSDAHGSDPNKALIVLEGAESGMNLYYVIKHFASGAVRAGRYSVNLSDGTWEKLGSGWALPSLSGLFAQPKAKYAGIAFAVAVVSSSLWFAFGGPQADVQQAKAPTGNIGFDTPIEISESGQMAGLTGSDQEKLKVATFLASMDKPAFDAYVESKSTGDPQADIQTFTYLASLRASGLAIKDAGGLPNAFVPPAAEQPATATPYAISLSGPGAQASISVFADPQCPACQHYEKILEDEIGDRAITIYPVAILEGSDYIIDQIMCSDNPTEAWRHYMKHQELKQEVSVQGCAAAFAHEKNLELFSSAGLTQTPSTFFESIPERAIIGSVIPDQMEAQYVAGKLK